MIKLIVAIRKRAEMSVAEFQTHWRTKHARLVRECPDYLRDVQPDEARFADMSQTVFFMTREETVLGG